MNKTQEYIDYINNHINYVKEAFHKYGELLCKELNLNYLEIEEQINYHDESKWDKEEFDLYKQKFYPEPNEKEISDYEFNKAWLHHIHNNPHHPQHWIYYNDEDNNLTVYDIPDNYILEMILDWIAMGKTHNDTCYNYYFNKGGKDKLFKNSTRTKVEYLLNKIKEFDNK